MKLSEINKILSGQINEDITFNKIRTSSKEIEKGDLFLAINKGHDYINEAIDEVAENLLMMGGKPLASLKDFLANASIEEAEMKEIKSKEIYKVVLADFRILLEEVKEIKVSADEENNYLISALMDEYIKQFSKSIWMIGQVVED